MAYRQSRNIEASLIDFLTANLNADWSGVSCEKTFAKIYEIDLPSVWIRTSVTTHDKAQIGDDATIRTVQVLIDIFAENDGQKLDLIDYIVSKIKNGCIYYEYTIANGQVQSKTANGRIRIMDIDVTLIDEGTDKEKLDVHDRYRALITLSASLGRIEA